MSVDFAKKPEETENNQIEANQGAPADTPKHKAYGKVPKYLKQYQKDADELAQQRAVLEAKKKLPPGTRQIPEEERIKTLEDLIDTKKELH